MRFMLTTVYVEDLEESKGFYQKILGLKEVKKLKPRPGVEISFLQDKESSTIELIADENTNKAENNSSVSIGFEVDDMDTTIADLESEGIEISRGPIETPNGTKLAFTEDPNGVEIEFIANLTL